MLPHRFAPSQSSTQRKSRLGDGKQSLLPKPVRSSSMDRLSTEARSTFGVSRMSREASATKLPTNRRSRSQQGERLGQSYMTPLRSSQPLQRPTTTPQRTPENCKNRNLQTSLERVLGFVTVKDQRPTSNVAWQRATMARVQEALAARGGLVGSDMALMRPLTIARFVNIVGALLRVIILKDITLNNDNYVAKLPHMAKWLLYPAPVAKSWLKTVNTLHAFPNALALIAYLLDLADHIETPLSDDIRLYLDQKEDACLRRIYLDKSWSRFQELGCEFDDLNEEYQQSLKAYVGDHHAAICELKQTISNYELTLAELEDTSECAEEASLLERREALAGALREEKSARAKTRAAAEAQPARLAALQEAEDAADADTDRATVEIEQLNEELQSQVMSVAERAQVQEEVRYVTRVLDSKRALAENIAKMVASKEDELALWQEKTLESCAEYKQALIHLSVELPQLAPLAIDENELMGAECAQKVSRAAEVLREMSCALKERRSQRASERTALARKRAAQMDEAQAKAAALKVDIERRLQAYDDDIKSEQLAVAECNQIMQESHEKLKALLQENQEHARTQQTLESLQEQSRVNVLQVTEMVRFIAGARAEAAAALAAAVAPRAAAFCDAVEAFNRKLDAC